MRAKFGIAVIVSALTIVAISHSLGVSRAAASNSDDKAAIATLENRLTDAFNKMDPGAAMTFYMKDADAVYFEDVLPFQIKGWNSLNEGTRGFYKEMKVTQWQASVEALSVEVSGKLAAAHFIVPIKWTDKNGQHFERARGTHIFKKVDGKWLIWHEHLSVPFDPATGKAVLDASPSKD
jgi:ketosteroid isomerase-like protein